jgi:hypothetical protein
MLLGHHHAKRQHQKKVRIFKFLTIKIIDDIDIFISMNEMIIKGE